MTINQNQQKIEFCSNKSDVTTITNHRNIDALKNTLPECNITSNQKIDDVIFYYPACDNLGNVGPMLLKKNIIIMSDHYVTNSMIATPISKFFAANNIESKYVSCEDFIKLSLSEQNDNIRYIVYFDLRIVCANPRKYFSFLRIVPSCCDIMIATLVEDNIELSYAFAELALDCMNFDGRLLDATSAYLAIRDLDAKKGQFIHFRKGQHTIYTPNDDM